MIDVFMKKTNGLSIIVWVLSIPVRPKLPLKVRCLLKKVIILNCSGLQTLALVQKGQETELLVSCNTIDKNQRPLNLRP
jgi:hypothetical protein